MQEQLAGANSTPATASTDEKNDWATEKEFLQRQLDDKSREIFSIKIQAKEGFESQTKLLIEKDTEISQLSEQLRSSQMQLVVDLEALLKKKDEELNAMKQKLAKYMSVAKLKVKELELKEEMIGQLKSALEASSSKATGVTCNISQSTVSSFDGHKAPTDMDSDEFFLLVHRIACFNLKNVEAGSSISGMFGGAISSALSSALGTENDPFVTVQFQNWSLKTPTIQEGGSNVEWNNLQARIILRKSDFQEPLFVDVFDENSIRANVHIGRCIVNLQSLLDKKNEIVDFNLELEDSAGERAGMISLGLAIFSHEKIIADLVDDSNLGSKLGFEVVEVERLKEVLAQRERSLEMTAQAMSDAVKTSEEKDITINELLRRLDDLSLELQEKDTTLRMSQNQQSIIEELKQKCESLEKDIMENKSVIEAFTEEGRILAKKQSDLEKINRKIKEMLKKKDMELESVKSLHSEPSDQESLKFSDEVAVAKAELTSTQLKLSSSEGEKLDLLEEITRLRSHFEFMVNFMILFSFKVSNI